jgi:epidermal growth factor receptor substrate 15
MKLIRNTRSNIPLPNVLPESLKQIAPSPPQPAVPIMRPPAYGMPVMPPTYLPGQIPAVPVQPTFTMGTKELCDWTIPQSNKLKYSQRFNTLDKDRNDYLTGQQVRGVMGESQLPAHILAQIWNFADSNKDGYLTIERFCVAMFLIDKVKEGYALPKTIPPELQSYMSRSKTQSPATTPQDPNAPPPQKTPTLKTFDDKRRDNLSKGEEELQRRREILKAEEDRRRAEIERKEAEEAQRQREEFERKERERAEEMERRMEEQRKFEEERAAKEAQLKAEREEARKKAEEARMKLLEERHVQDLEVCCFNKIRYFLNFRLNCNLKMKKLPKLSNVTRQ